jgi:hypothetical protein
MLWYLAKSALVFCWGTRGESAWEECAQGKEGVGEKGLRGRAFPEREERMGERSAESRERFLE